ncbi:MULTISPECIES: hypothetical protein [Streptomyces]|uniref:hypothetical protein n=1 Tax=Streptomyces TaxID=1883 RepID=UPI001B33F697|nr:hypothetical protein [Streptomyces sp. AgN23]QTI90583.1 hypothetical protein AS97_60900 [Streptomyces sp. AgN23]
MVRGRLAGGLLTSLALVGGPDGMRGAMRSFARTIEGWWSDSGTPRLDEDVRARLIAAADEVLSNRPINDVLAARDAAAVDVLALRHVQDRDVPPGA